MLCWTLSNCQFKLIFSIAVANADWCNLRLNKIKDLCLFSRLVNITLVSIVFKLLTLLALIKPWLFTGWFRAFYCNTVREIIVLPMFFFQNKQALDELLHKPTMYFLIYFPFFWCIVLFLCEVLSIYGSLQAWSVQSNFLTFTKYSVLSGKLIIAFWKRKVVEHYGSKGMFLTYSLWYCIIKRKWNS